MTNDWRERFDEHWKANRQRFTFQHTVREFIEAERQAVARDVVSRMAVGVIEAMKQGSEKKLPSVICRIFQDYDLNADTEESQEQAGS